VDIIQPNLRITVEKAVANGSVSATTLGYLYSLTGTTNSSSYNLTVHGKTMTFAAGELLFEGAELNVAEVNGVVESWNITWNFLAGPNRTGLTIAGISGVALDAFEYLWVYTQRTETGGEVTPDVKGVYVAQVYPEGNFTNLGI
jgi:hypothetical protein